MNLETKLEKSVKLLRKTMDKHGLTDWTAKISNAAKIMASYCHGTKTISISSNFIKNETETNIMNLILYEIIHVTATGDDVQKKAAELGLDMKQCLDSIKKIKLDLKYNFECEHGCRASYTKKCKAVDHLMTGQGKCKKHGFTMKQVASEDNEDHKNPRLVIGPTNPTTETTAVKPVNKYEYLDKELHNCFLIYVTEMVLCGSVDCMPYENYCDLPKGDRGYYVRTYNSTTSKFQKKWDKLTKEVKQQVTNDCKKLTTKEEYSDKHVRDVFEIVSKFI